MNEYFEKVNVIKPCPFCGGYDLNITSKEKYNRIGNEGMTNINGKNHVLIMQCDTCGVEMHTTSIPDGMEYEKAVRVLYAKWNTRRERA